MAWLRRVLSACVLVLGGLLSLPASAQNSSMELLELRVEQAEDGLYLSAHMRFELPPAVEEALLKGVPMSFVAEAQAYRHRWYWTDKLVAQTSRSVRLSFQPLTRRWRVNVSAGSANNSGSGSASLGQTFDQLSDALAVVRRLSRWKIAEGNEIVPDARHSVVFRFALDVSQLPRPMQIGITGNTDWNLSVQRVVRPER